MKRNYLPFTLIFLLLCLSMLFSAAQRPNIGGYNVYYGHLHNHTGVSDGTGTPDDAYNYARYTAGLDFFSLSEHSEMMDDTEWATVKNAANTYNQNGVFAAFYGFEWSSIQYGHVSVIGTEDYCSYLSSSTDNFSELLTWVNTHNGIAFFNHPGWAWWALQEFNHFTNTPSDKFVGMELWNDVDGFSKYYYNDGFYGSDGGKNYFEEALARGWKIGSAGSDDNHVSTWGTRKPWRVGVLAVNLNRSEIMEAFVARRFFSTLDNNLGLSLTVNGAQMGSTTTGGNVTVVIKASDAGGEIFSKVELYKNGTVLQSWTPFITNPEISYETTCINNDYFYVKVTQSTGDEAISSPVFISGTANTAPVVTITSPFNGAQFNEGNPINIVATASDPDGTVAKVEFYQGITKLGEDPSAPYEYSWTQATAGTYSLTAKAFDNLGASTVSATVAVTVNAVQPPLTSSIEKRVLSKSDDAEQYTNGTVVLNHKVLNIVYESKTTGNQDIGLRFTGLTIPQGATITKAYIEFVADKTSSGTASLTLYGEKTDNATTFTTVLNNISSRVITTAFVAWSPQTWSAAGVYQSNDIKTIVQEIVNRIGWKSGNSMAFIITGTGMRTAESVEGTPSGKAPLLHVEYTTPAALALQKSAVIHDDEMVQKEGLLLYPNPVHNVLTLKFDEKTEVERILVYSITGSLVKEIKVNKVMTETQVDCSNFVPGTYLLKLSSSKGIYSMQFIKQ